jgi:tripeptidyl-peptidase-1
MKAAIVLLFALIVVIAARRERVEMQGFRGTNGWSKTIPAPAEHVLKVIIAPKLRNLDRLDTIFWAVSTPGDAQYGKHLTREAMSNLVSPKPASINKIKAWLATAGVTKVELSSGGDFLHVEATVAQMAELLKAQFHVYRHTSGALLVRTTSYSVPAAIAPLVDVIVGVNGLPRLNKKRTQATPIGADNLPITPDILRTRYNVTDVGIAGVNNSMAVAEFQAQYFVPNDLVDFFTKFLPGNKNNAIFQVVGTNNPKVPGTEAELDTQYIMGVAPNIQTWVWSTPNNDFWAGLMDWASWVGNNTVPYVHSVSYGDQLEDQPPEDYKQRLNVEFQKLGAMGHSLIIASGDDGTGCEHCDTFQASFPSTSPYVTAVGATEFMSGTSGPEHAVEFFSSGGGFSRSFIAPSYQTAAIAQFFKVGTPMPPANSYNHTGRGTPDVSALGTGFQVFQDGKIQDVGGTSASTPTFSAIIALLNQARIQAKKSTLGFLNPWIYQSAASTPGAFFDVTQGSNPEGCCKVGFPCAVCWDTVSVVV